MDIDAPEDNGAPIGLMVIVGGVCLDVDPDGIPDNAEPMTPRDGCVN